MSYRSHFFTKGWKNLKSRNKMFNLINLMMQMLQNAYSFLITTSSLKLIIYSWDMRPCMIFYLILKTSCHRLKLSTIILWKMMYIVIYGIFRKNRSMYSNHFPDNLFKNLFRPQLVCFVTSSNLKLIFFVNTPTTKWK